MTDRPTDTQPPTESALALTYTRPPSIGLGPKSHLSPLIFLKQEKSRTEKHSPKRQARKKVQSPHSIKTYYKTAAFTGKQKISNWLLPSRSFPALLLLSSGLNFSHYYSLACTLHSRGQNPHVHPFRNLLHWSSTTIDCLILTSSVNLRPSPIKSARSRLLFPMHFVFPFRHRHDSFSQLPTWESRPRKAFLPYTNSTSGP